MDTLQLPKKREKVADEEVEDQPKQGVKGSQPTKQQHSSTSTSPPSASSSPSHEFSFTISLHPSSTTPEETKSPPSSFAIDLSPADDIFFHGHLLPLHLLSHLPISPRSSINSLDSFSVPSKDLVDCKPNSSNSSSSSSSSSSTTSTTTTTTNSRHSSRTDGTKGRTKLKSLSFFGLAKWQKGCEVIEKDKEEDEGEKEEDEGEKEKKKRKIRIDVGHILKRYVRMVQPLFFFSNGRKENREFLRQTHSFSGNSSWRGNSKQERRGRRGGGGVFSSAPASMRTSPSNSGLLLATESLPSHTNDSTMEELQNAIQAAIAHCKNSIATKDEKLKC